MNFISLTLDTIYVATEAGQECSSNLMSTPEECEAAMPQIQDIVPGAYYLGALSRTDRPYGCFYCCNQAHFYWNTNSLAKASGRWQSICKQRKIALHFYFS